MLQIGINSTGEQDDCFWPALFIKSVKEKTQILIFISLISSVLSLSACIACCKTAAMYQTVCM